MADPQSLQASILSLIEREDVAGARQLAAEAVALFPGHSTLEQMHHFLRPGRVVRSAAREPDRSRAFARLAEDAEKLRGCWVALSEDDVVASAETLKELLAVVQPMALEYPPLVHFIE
ncbi:MAG TPA: hypothetical protein VH988_10555 [Thermoanaerobaculia bacterium]|nr:hypothetical protein [Thermoanaerobaculia bacterium]